MFYVMIKLSVILISVLTSSLILNAKSEKPVLKLWYKQPADEWMKSTPIGNGRLGAMIFGGINNDRIALNEITMWAGQPDPNQELPCGKEKLAEIRKLFFESNIEEGNKLAINYLSGKPNTFGTHIPVGDLKLNFNHNETGVSDYRRELNLENAITTVSYKIDKINYTREYFCSNPDNILIIRLSSDKLKSVSCTLSLDLLSKSDITASKNQIEFTGKAKSTLKVNGFPTFSDGGVDFIGKIHASVRGGRIETGNGSLKIVQADEVILTIDIRTNYNSPDYKGLCENTIMSASSKKYDQIKQAHIKDYAKLFKRVEVSFGHSEVENLPTDERFAQYKSGKADPNMPALFMQYGRYLLISSSRENSPLPANLQGLWNDNLAANMPWTCDYHLDINTQQNYWPANITNLAECNIPLFNYVVFLAKHGEKTAMKVYGSPGWVAHTVTNVWGYTAPGEWPGWGLFPTASAWIASHLWEHYLFTKDIDFLKNQAYPLLKKNAEFFLDYMTVNPDNGYLMTGPSTSPENSFSSKGKVLSLSMMPTCDRVFVYELFTACITSSEILGTDSDFSRRLEIALKKLPPIKIGKNGTIQEWFEDYDIPYPNHRHTTHLNALYPYSQISLVKTPDLAKAAKKTIDDKLTSKGWEDVEWSRANMINFYARLKEPQLAYNSVFMLLKNLTRENLFTISVAGIAGAKLDIYVMDGNSAGTSGIAEMLIQSHEGYVEFIPALPMEWETGYFKGLCVREGATADVSWENGTIRKASLKANRNNSFNIKLPDIAKAKFLRNGKPVKVDLISGDIASINLKKNDLLEIHFGNIK
jgi:alpha-L-fucosidase 2